MDRKLPQALQILSFVLSTMAVILILTIARHKGAFLPDWIEWDGNVKEEIPAGLTERLDKSWLIQDALCFDIDGDGEDDEILLVWKRGSYGEHRPTWVTKDEDDLSQHIFIYSKRSDGWHPVWMSSKLGIDVSCAETGEEIAGTGRKSLDLISPKGEVSRWGWLSWGLQRVDDQNAKVK